MKNLFSVVLLAISWLFCLQQAASGVYINSSFRDEGDGLHLARSFDGYCWTAFNNDEPLLCPAPGQGSWFRDTSIVRGPDNRYHMVWTSTPTSFGYTSSPDLVHWEPQRLVPVTGSIPNAQNCWAPELFYDEGRSEYRIIWATSTGSLDNDQKLYTTTTTDFQTFTSTQLYYDPGFSVIDGAILQHGSNYTLFFKDNRTTEKRMKIVTSDDITPGSFDGKTSYYLPTTASKYVEGPQPIKIGDYYYCYYDHYQDGGGYDQYYGALRSSDLTNWTDVHNQMVFPDDTRHGCVFEASNEAYVKLLALPGQPPLTNSGFESSMNGIFDTWDYGENSAYISNGSVVESTDSVISGDVSAKIGYVYGKIRQKVETSPTWQLDLDFALLEGSTRALGMDLCAKVGGVTGPERIVLKSQDGTLYALTSGSGWVDLGLEDADETSGAAWTGQTPVVNHLTINGYFDAATPHYTVTLNDETSVPITGWYNGTGSVVAGSIISDVYLTGAFSGGSGNVNCWLADNVELKEFLSNLCLSRHYSFDWGDMSGGTLLDSSPNNSSATVSGGTDTIVYGQHQQAIDFDGASAVLGSTSGLPGDGDDFSVAFWAKLSDWDGQSFIAFSQTANGIAYTIGFHNLADGLIVRTDFGSTRIDGIDLSGLDDDEFAHFLIEFGDDGGIEEIYLNGAAQGSDNSTYGWNFTDADTAVLGGRLTDDELEWQFDGAMDDFAIIMGHLNADEREQLIAYGVYSIDFSEGPSPVPEPSVYVLLCGLPLLLLRLGRQSRQRGLKMQAA